MKKTNLLLIAIPLLFVLSFSLFAQDNTIGISNDRAPYINSQSVQYPMNLLSYNSRAFGYNAYGTAVALGPFKMWLSTPFAMTSLYTDPLSSNFVQAASFANGFWYGVRYGTNALVKIDTSTGLFTTVATVTGASSITGMAWDYTSSTMYACNYVSGASNCGTLNLTTGVYTPLAGTNTATGLCIDMACSNSGQLYVHWITGLTSNSQIYSVNKTTGAWTALSSNTGFIANYAQGMSWDHSVDTGYLAAYNYTTSLGELRKINIATGATTLVGALNCETDGFMIPAPPPAPPSGPMYYNLNTGTSSNSFPFNMSGGKATNYLFLAGDFANPTPCPSGKQITKVYFRTGNGNTTLFNNLQILLAQDSTITTLTSGQFYPGPYDTVYIQDTTTLTGITGGWMGVTLKHPFRYNPAKALIIFAGQCGYTGSGITVYNSTTTGIRRVWSVGGCPFAPYASGDASTLNFGFDVVDAPPPTTLYYNYMDGLGANSFPLGIAGGKMVQWLVGPGEFNQPTPAPYSSILGFSVRIATGYPLASTTYSQFNILFGQTDITSLTSGTFYTGTRDTVFKRASVTLSAGADTWLTFTLDHPFIYHPNQSLVIQMEQCGAPNATGYPLAHTTLSVNRRVWSVGGCPFVPYAGVGTNVLNCGINVTPLSGIPPVVLNVPDKYKLEQNYPNPFNPVTKINYSITTTGLVTLKVYNILGQEVMTLVNEVKKAGSYFVDFDASNFSSGVYFYSIKAGDFNDSKRMVLVK